MLSIKIIEANLQTRILGKEIEYYPSLGSTNTEALVLLEGGAKEGTVVVTDNQTAGRGRHGHSWFSQAGKGLTFSIILTPNIAGKSVGLISIVAGLAVGDSIERFQLVPQLKWPNDILLSGKKCGGILVETRFQGNVLSSAIVGMGLNVNENRSEFPETIRPTTTSLSIEKESPVQRELAMAWILNSFERWYLQLKSGDIASIIPAWENRSAHLDKKVSFSWKGETTSGIFKGLAEDGEAIIRHLDDSGQMTLSSQEISIVRER